MYLGTLLGVEFNQSSSVSPSIELRYLPIYGKYKDMRPGAVEVAVQLGLGN